MTSKTRRRNVGKEFETDFSSCCPSEYYLVRLQDGKVTKPNPCDYILLAKGKGIMLELKTTKEKRLPSQNIKPHQLEIMSKCHEELDIPAYFVVNFRCCNETYLASAYWVRLKLSRGKSIPLADFQQECVKIGQSLKRTRYKYDYDWVADVIGV